MNENEQNVNSHSENQFSQPISNTQGSQPITDVVSKKQVKWRSYLFLTVVLIILFLIAGSWYFILHSKLFSISSQKNQQKQSLSKPLLVPTSTESTFSEADRQRLETGLVSQDLNIFRKVLADEIELQVKSSILPAGSTMNIDIKSFHSNKPGFATINAEVTGAKPGKYELILIFEDNQWKVIGTNP